ncbi:ependymin-2-like [Hoplias malabaricus]|uniref:ependymin-2-like n=1 Tax=Hoplias malabaricus TaxID=27720 RepID=UPI00346325E1
MNYLLGVALVGILAGNCLAERPHPHPTHHHHPHPHPTHHHHPPHPCKSPPEVEGSLSVTTPSGEFFSLGKYVYDAKGQRIRFENMGQYKNESFKTDVLLLFKEHVMYEINTENETCVKKELKGTFHPMEIPDDATLLGQVVLGSLSEPGEGLLVNSWTGDIPEAQGKYFLIFTEFGCLPVTSLYHSPKTGWITTSFFNIIVGIKDPRPLTPPPFCTDAMMEVENADFFSTFF